MPGRPKRNIMKTAEQRCVLSNRRPFNQGCIQKAILQTPPCRMFLHAARLRGQAVKACRQIRWLSSASSLKRRKVLLVGAFNGSDFYGSYASAESEVRTVDSELWAAAAACGRHTHNNAALEMSAPPADPNQWSRASRTDKGVGNW